MLKCCRPTSGLRRVDFEVFGKVQEVHFRKMTMVQAKQLGVRGWIRNTYDETVQGQIEGEAKKVEQMKEWLRSQGSPGSKIEKTVFCCQVHIKEYDFETFTILDEDPREEHVAFEKSP